MKQVALYARTSTSKSETSIPDQLKLMRAFVREKGWEVESEHQEQKSAHSDDIKSRPIFRSLIQKTLSKSHPIDAILTLTFDRFCRNVLLFRIVKEELRKAGVDVIHIQTQIDSKDPSSRFMEVVMEGTAQLYSDMLSVRVSGSMLEVAKRGKFPGGTPKYAFCGKDGKISVVKEEKEVTQLIFKWYIAGMGAISICGKLNESGMLHRGKDWTPNFVLRVLNEPSYRGFYHYNLRDGKSRKPKPESEWIKIPVERVISDEQWERVQILKKARSPAVTNPAIVSSSSLLTGLAYCGLCESKLIKRSAKSGKHHYYECSSRMRKSKKCKGQRIPVRVLEESIVYYLTEELFQPPKLRSMLKDFYRNWRRSHRDDERLKSACGKEIKSKQRKLDRIIEVISDSKGEIDYSDFSKRIRSLKQEIAELTEKYKSYDIPELYSPERFSDKDWLRFHLEMSELFRHSDKNTKKRALKSVVERIDVIYPKAVITTKVGLISAMLNNPDALSWELPSSPSYGDW